MCPRAAWGSGGTGVWLSAETCDTRFPELSLWGNPEHRTQGTVGSMQIPCVAVGGCIPAERQQLGVPSFLSPPLEPGAGGKLCTAAPPPPRSFPSPAPSPPGSWLLTPAHPICSPLQPHLAVGSNDYYISVYSVEKRVR